MMNQTPTFLSRITDFFYSLWIGFRSAPLVLKLLIFNTFVAGPVLVVVPFIPFNEYRINGELVSREAFWTPGFYVLWPVIGSAIFALGCGVALRKRWTRILSMLLVVSSLVPGFKSVTETGDLVSLLLASALALLIAYWFLFKKKSVTEFFCDTKSY